MLLLTLTPHAIGAEAAGLSTAIAQATQSDVITTTGRVVPTHKAQIGARLSGHIVEWGKTEDGRPLDVGYTVKADQLLFKLESSTYADRVRVAEAALKLAQAQLADLKAWTRKERVEALRATLDEIDARLAERKRDEERFRRLVEVDKTMPVKRLEEVQLQIRVLHAQRRGAQARLAEAEAGPTATQVGVAEAQVQQARTQLQSATEDLNATEVKAPFAGMISRRLLSPGDYVNSTPFTPVLELTSMDQLEAELRLPEKFYRRIVPGQTRVYLRSALLTKDIELTVDRLIPEIERIQSIFTFRLTIPPDSRGQLVPGAFLAGQIRLTGTSPGTVIPAHAVLTRDGKTVVFVAENARMHQREVHVGDRLSEGVIVRGIKPGERVVLGSDSELREGRALPPSTNSEPTPSPESPAIGEQTPE